jgi:hypothetical protein
MLTSKIFLSLALFEMELRNRKDRQALSKERKDTGEFDKTG